MSRSVPVSKADLHLHTTYSDGACSVDDLLRHVVERTDLRVIAVTDHDTIEGAWQAQQAVRASGAPVEVIVGEEVSSCDGHILGLWLTERVPPGLTARATVAAIQAQGGLAIAAHPFFRARRPARPNAPSMIGVGALLGQIAFDAVETINGTPCLHLANARARRFNRRYCRLPEIGGSDAHILPAVGKSHTLFAGETAADLRRALGTGAVVAATAWYRPGDLLAYASFWIRLSRAQGAPAI
jgi:predicted metal-dependent phosphoesterase TrpH